LLNRCFYYRYTTDKNKHRGGIAAAPRRN